MRFVNIDYQARERSSNPQNPISEAILQEVSLENIVQEHPTKIFAKRHQSEDELSNDSLPVIYVITPTYARPVQEAKLTQLFNVFATFLICTGY